MYTAQYSCSKSIFILKFPKNYRKKAFWKEIREKSGSSASKTGWLSMIPPCLLPGFYVPVTVMPFMFRTPSISFPSRNCTNQLFPDQGPLSA